MQIKTFKIPLGGGEMEEDLNRFLCGGSWNNNERNCRVANRNNNPDNRNNNGLRLAR